MTLVAILGILASGISAVSFLPQLIKIVTTKDTKSISLHMYILFCIGILLWLLYGALVKDLPIILVNLLIGVQAFIILGYKIKYK